MSEPKPKDEYLGDGVYISDDGYQLWLAVNHHDHKVVALEPSVFLSLVRVGARRLFNKDAAEVLTAAVQRMEKME